VLFHLTAPPGLQNIWVFVNISPADIKSILSVEVNPEIPLSPAAFLWLFCSRRRNYSARILTERTGEINSSKQRKIPAGKHPAGEWAN